jgi:hypothetical protein
VNKISIWDCRFQISELANQSKNWIHLYIAESWLSDNRLFEIPLYPITDTQHTIYNSVHAHTHTRNLIYWNDTPPPPQRRASSNPAPTALSVLYKNQKNARMGSEIFRSQLFDEFPHYPTLSAIQRFRLGRIIETQLYYFTTIRLSSLLRPNSIRIASVPTSERTVRYDAAV